MTLTSDTNHSDVLASNVEAYQRLAAMDPPAMRSLAAELDRLADESSALAVQQGTAETAATAGRSVERAAAARAALASPEPKG
jgi:hypothetical protein